MVDREREQVEALVSLAAAVEEMRGQMADLAEEVANLRARLLEGVERDLSWLMWRARQVPSLPGRPPGVRLSPEVELEQLRRRMPPGG
jgi:hypothetical protein